MLAKCGDMAVLHPCMNDTDQSSKKERKRAQTWDLTMNFSMHACPYQKYNILSWPLGAERPQGMQMGMLAGGLHPLQESLELRVSRTPSSKFASLAPWRSENGEKDDREDDDEDDKEEEEEKDDDDEDGGQLKHPGFLISSQRLLQCQHSLQYF